ncbi:ferric reductase transmembrane component 5 [Colletotrichum truncatum]|uniref:Ferric reductase transmembrane component 5 n=1 Tax=Colletotrichum truncatum TaxID=5467 RepID=A0ACC3YWK4_COLTU|nr:ferric reductase transmembrane component 5 [Colletotrichum truncatum]KAF6787479.1 ferric reductase transmembrane component 5 [Colletotrichum truncatum]
MNEWNLKLYAIILSAVAALFILCHWSRLLDKKTSFSARLCQKLPGFSWITKASRRIRSLSVGKFLYFPSGGHAVLTVAFIAVNIVLSFHHVERQTKNFASRFGWMTTANMALSVFLALKNTPLGILSGQSYERLNFLHRLAGCTAVLQLVLHAICYTVHFAKNDRLPILIEEDNWHGIAAGIGMIILLLGIARNLRYEAFYISHILGFLLATIFAALHRPHWVWKIPIAMVFIAAIWVIDRIIRGGRLLINLINNHATIYQLPDNGVRIVIKKPLLGAVPGSHCFVWIPSIRAFQTHPFTIVSNTRAGGLELVLNSYSGFTKAAYDCAHPVTGTVVRASVDGPYGAFPNPKNYDTVILIAGGTGASFTFGLATNLLQHLQSNSSTHVEFIWAVRKKENLEWFADHVRSLRQQQSGINMMLHVTRQSTNESLGTAQKSLESSTPAPEPTCLEISDQAPSGPMFSNAESKLPSYDTKEISKEARSIEDIDSLCDIKYDKLEVVNVIDQALGVIEHGQKVLVAGCGPRPLTDLVRTAVARHMASGELSIDIHCENFGY